MKHVFFLDFFLHRFCIWYRLVLLMLLTFGNTFIETNRNKFISFCFPFFYVRNVLCVEKWRIISEPEMTEVMATRLEKVLKWTRLQCRYLDICWIYVHSFKQSQFSGECRSVFNILFELQYSHWDTIKYQHCFSLLHSFVWRRIKDQMKNSYIRVRVQTWFVNERRWCRDVWICI